MKLKVALVAAYFLSVVGANWMIRHVGTPIPGGTHLIPVGLGLMAPSGTFLAAAVLVLRDLVQRSAGRNTSLLVIVPAAAATALMDVHLALASGAAFVLAELLDWGLYSKLAARLSLALVVSCAAGAALDSVVFLGLAGIPFAAALPGLLLGKAWVALAAWPAGKAARRLVPARVPAG